MTEVAAVTVVIPAFNPGARLARAVASVRAQTFTDWRIVVVDDGSDEDISTYLPDDARIDLIRQENRGVSAARNAGVARSASRWIAFLDADDEWMPEKLERQLGIVTPGVSAVHASFDWVLPESRFHSVRPPLLDLAALLAGETVCLSSVLVERRTLIDLGGFDEGLTHAEDLDLYFKLAAIAPLVAPEGILARYYTHEGGASTRYWTAYRRRLTVLRRAVERSGGDPAVVAAGRTGEDVARRLVAQQALENARADWSRRNPEAFVHLARMFRVTPVTATRTVAHWLLRMDPP